MMPLGRRARSRYLPVLPIRAILGQTPAFTARFQCHRADRPQPMLKQTNKTSQTSLWFCSQKCKSQNLSGSSDFIFWGSENIYKALKTSEPQQKLHGEILSHTVHFSGLQIPKIVANSRVFSLKLFLCNTHSFLNPAIWKYSPVLGMFWSSFGTLYRINNLWFGGKTIPILCSMDLLQYAAKVSTNFPRKTGMDVM